MILKKYLLFTTLTAYSLYSANPSTIIGTVADSDFDHPYALAITPDGSTVYVTNFASSSVNLVDVTTNTVTGTVADPDTTFNEPFAIAITPDGSTGYVVNSNGTVSYIDMATNTAGLVIDTAYSTFNTPVAVAVTADSTQAYVVNRGNNTLSVIAVATNTVAIPALIVSSLDSPRWMAIRPDGKQAYIGNEGNNTVTVFDVAHMITAGTINPNGLPFSFPFPAIFTPDGTKAYIPNFTGLNVNIVDVAHATVTGRVADPQSLFANSPQQSAITPNGNTAYFLADNNVIIVVDVATNTATGTVSDPLATLDSPLFMAITPNGTTGYITNYNGNSVSIMAAGPAAPSFVNGCREYNSFLLQQDLINKITWRAPSSGSTPVSYNIYRDSELTNFVATVSASGTLQYLDHNRSPNIVYSYYIVSVDQDDNVSTANSVTVTQSC